MGKFVHGKRVGESSEKVNYGSKDSMRSKLGGHFAGFGTELAFTEDIETYRDRKEYNVRFENDVREKDKFDKMCKELSGDVKVLRIEELQR